MWGVDIEDVHVLKQKFLHTIIFCYKLDLNNDFISKNQKKTILNTQFLYIMTQLSPAQVSVKKSFNEET